MENQTSSGEFCSLCNKTHTVAVVNDEIGCLTEAEWLRVFGELEAESKRISVELVRVLEEVKRKNWKNEDITRRATEIIRRESIAS